MGLVSGQLRVMFLTLYKSNLEFRIQLITQTKLQMSNSVNELVSIGSDLDPESPELRQLNQRREKLKLVEDKLDTVLEQYQNQLKSVETELDSAQKIIDANVKRAFTYGVGGGQ